MSSPVKKTSVDEAVEDLAGEMQTALLETSIGGTTAALEETLGHIMSAVTNVQDAVSSSDGDTYPGWLATDMDPPPPHA